MGELDYAGGDLLKSIKAFETFTTKTIAETIVARNEIIREGSFFYSLVAELRSKRAATFEKLIEANQTHELGPTKFSLK